MTSVAGGRRLVAPLRTASPTQGIMADAPALRKLVLVREIRDRGDRYLKEGGGRVVRNLVDFDWKGLLNWAMNFYFGTGVWLIWLCRRLALCVSGQARDGAE